MKVAALYDVHGNLPALEAVMADQRFADADVIVSGGDLVAGPLPAECLDRVEALGERARFLTGNGDREVVAPTGDEQWHRDVGGWSAARLTADRVERVRSWPATVELDVAGLGAVLFCHATPRNDTEIFTRLTTEDRLVPVFAEAEASLVVCGHTHIQFDRMIGKTRVMNAGSIGMPFGQPGADWLLLESTPQLRHTGYDLEAAAARIRATAYPEAEEFAAGHVIRSPSEAEMLERFAAMELG